MGGAMSIIVPDIYVGGLSSAKSKSQLDEHEITHILTVLNYPVSLDSTRTHKQFIIRDDPEENLARHFVDSSEFIHRARMEHGTVLIHCACGISRSVTLTMAYLLCITDFSLRDIFKAMRAARIGAHPNSGFLRQLLKFEEHGGHKQARDFLTTKYGIWPAERVAADAEAILQLIAVQNEFILTGYYPGDERAFPENDVDDDDDDDAKKTIDSGKNKPTRFIVRLPDGARTLDEALQEDEQVEEAKPGEK